MHIPSEDCPCCLAEPCSIGRNIDATQGFGVEPLTKQMTLERGTLGEEDDLAEAWKTVYKHGQISFVDLSKFGSSVFPEELVGSSKG